VRVVTPEQMRAIDANAINEYGIPGIVLMENAAIKTFSVIDSLYKNYARVLILAGVGNNGGDGLALARLLYSAGKEVHVILIGEESAITKDAGINLEIAKKLLIPLTSLGLSTPVDEVRKIVGDAINHADIIIDALFGTGLSRPLDQVCKVAVDMLNKRSGKGHRKTPVISLDIPSGINGENGAILGSAVEADDTVAFGYPKMGHLLYPGKMFTGRLHVVPISLPPESADRAKVKSFTLNESEVAMGLLQRLPWGNKGTFGKVAVIAGSTGMTGAACLSSMAALKSGAGVVTLGIPASLNPILENKLTEVMTFPLTDSGRGSLCRECTNEISVLLKDKDVCAIGPGLGRDDSIFYILKYIFINQSIPIVLDADGLNQISENLSLLKNYAKPVILTPHPGEMARLTGKSIEDIVSQPVKAALELAVKLSKIVLLKGAATIVACPEGRIYINNTGNSGMATAGSGDVLTGLIAGLLAQKYDPYFAAVYGAFVHGLAGDIAANEKGQDSLTAGDILDHMPYAIKKLRNLYCPDCKSTELDI